MLPNLEPYHKTILTVLDINISEISHKAHIDFIRLTVENLFSDLEECVKK